MPNPHPRPDQADPLGFLLALLAARTNPHAPAQPLDPLDVMALARHRIDLPALDVAQCEELEVDTATDVLQELRTHLTDALVPADASAGREVLNQVLDAWQAGCALEEELGPDELPGVELVARVLPPVPLPFWYARVPGTPHATAERCPQAGPFLLGVASVLLSAATNIHLSGYADRGLACAAHDCARPFIDAGDSGRRRYCAPRCRARQSARDRAWVDARARGW